MTPAVKEEFNAMTSDHDAKMLHDRATRGMVLTDEEKAALVDWYNREDEAEAKLLDTEGSDDTLALLHAQVNAAIAQLAVSTQRIQETAADNERIRREIAELRHQLANAAFAQAA